MKGEIIKMNPKLKNDIQLIGDGNSLFNNKKNVTICVYNSIGCIKDFEQFKRIYVDEAHHINKPEIYCDNDEETETDVEDSEENITSYIGQIEALQKYNNNALFSATIDNRDGFEYYHRDIREMIDLGYLCDYTINIPIFDSQASNRNICEYLIRRYFSVIIYSNSQKEGKEIYTIMDHIQGGCCGYIDCKTSKKERQKILQKYENGELGFLVNVRILVEAFNSPRTEGVCFMHMPSSNTLIIQIIGRALRLYSGKYMAKVILPFSTDEDQVNISKFVTTIAKHDSRIRKSYNEKGLVDIFHLRKWLKLMKMMMLKKLKKSQNWI